MISADSYKKYTKIVPAKYYNNGPKYFDPFRKVLVHVTPEERVRIRTAFFLRDVLGVPAEMIHNEDHLSHYGIKKNLRADIVVCPSLTGPMAVVECKSDRAGLSDQTLEQAVRYAKQLDVRYVFICDGKHIECHVKERHASKYVLQNGLPLYKEMIEGVYIPSEPIKEVLQRTELSDQINPDDYSSCIGEDTLPEKHKSIINLAEAILDLSHMINPHLHKSGIEFIEDLGLSYRSYGDASGGGFGTGLYRLLLVKHPNRKSYIYGLSVQATGKTFNDVKYGNLTGKSVLIVAVKGNKSDNIIVQINLNMFLEIKDEHIVVRHNGKFGIKNARSQKFVSKVAIKEPDLVDDGKIVLGILPSNDLLYFDQMEMIDFIANLIRYCELRATYKTTLNRSKKAR